MKKIIKQANKITRSINEVKKIESGKKKAKSFDEFLKELSKEKYDCSK